jgi:hypothetical protein
MPSRNGAVHVATTQRVYKGRVYQTHLLRRTYRDGEQVKHETLGNLSHLPPDLIDTIRLRLRSGEPAGPGGFQILRTVPHGHVVATLGMLRAIGLDQVLASRPSRERQLVIAMIVARIIHPGSKLATARGLKNETCTSSLNLELQLGAIEDRELYEALDWLQERQTKIEKRLAQRHLHDGTLVLYDVSSSYYTGRKSELVRFGYNRDGRREFPQIVYGLLCNGEGCPVAVEVFPGNTADSTTLGAQIQKLRSRFGVRRVVVVGDRGLITSKCIDDTFRGVEGLDWITALRADSIKQLASGGQIQPSLFDERNLGEITSPDYPGERLIVCRNPALGAERSRKRGELLAATEKELEAIAAATHRAKRPLRGKEKIGLRVGKVLNRFKVGKHYQLDIRDDGFSYQRDAAKIAAEAALDGIYVIRTSVGSDVLNSENVVRAYKDLSQVERAFRSLKTVDLKVRPIYHWLEDRIRAHVFLCMLAYHVEWHLRRPLAPLLFDDHEREAAEESRASIVAPAPRSDAARSKDATKQTESRTPVHSFRTLLADLGTLAKNLVRMADSGAEFYKLTQATPLQQQVFDLLDFKPTL